MFLRFFVVVMFVCISKSINESSNLQIFFSNIYNKTVLLALTCLDHNNISLILITIFHFLKPVDINSWVFLTLENLRNLGQVEIFGISYVLLGIIEHLIYKNTFNNLFIEYKNIAIIHLKTIFYI